MWRDKSVSQSPLIAGADSLGLNSARYSLHRQTRPRTGEAGLLKRGWDWADIEAHAQRIEKKHVSISLHATGKYVTARQEQHSLHSHRRISFSLQLPVNPMFSTT